MKRLIIFAIILLAVALIGTLSPDHILFFSYCDKPVSYHVDTIDPKFNLSRREFLQDTEQAANIWNKAGEKNLFIFDPKGALSINLIYDDRQSLTSQIYSLENSLQSKKEALVPKISEYQRGAAEFGQKVDDLKKDIQYWNSQGGAPPEEYKKIILRQQQLQSEANDLNNMAKNLNISGEFYNTQVNQLDQSVRNLNELLTQRPEEGIYKGGQKRIEIYFNISHTELVHTLAHELGHALGIGHLNNQDAIMYSKTTQNLIPSYDDIAALEDICKKHIIFELIPIYYSQISNYLADQFLVIYKNFNKQP